MRSVVYQPNNVVHLSTAVGAALVVTFSPSEKVTAVAVTDSKDLIVSPRDNFLFFKAKTVLQPQPVVVLTSGPRGVRRYVLEVEAQDAASMGLSNASIYYSVEFTYPSDIAADRASARAKSLAKSHDEQRKLEVSAALTRAHSAMETATADPLIGVSNWRYVAQGDHSLQPLEVLDNGSSTAFRFPGNTRIPGIYRIDPDGKEASVNYYVKGNYVIVGAVASGWRLRDGTTVLCVFNRAYDQVGRTTGTNTTSPYVTRVVRSTPQ
jgi:type IV secretion system protein VirB9